MATIFLTFTMPVSMSTATSANWQPPTPTLDSPCLDTSPSRRSTTSPACGTRLSSDITGSPETQSWPSLSERSRGRGLDGRRDLLEERIARLGGRVVGRRGHRRRRGRAPRSLARREARVADVREDVGRLEPENLGGDDRQHRPRTGADVLRRTSELDRAIGVDRARDLLVLGAAAAPLVQGHAQPMADRPGPVLAARLAFLVPADQLGPHLELGLVDGRVEIAGGEVLEPELERVHAQLVGQVVHGGFGQRTALRMPRGPHGSLVAEVGQHRRLRYRRVGHAVDVGQDHVGTAADAAGASRIGDQGDELAVAVGAHLDVGPAAGTVARRQVLLHAVKEHLDRPAAGHLGELGRRPAPDIGIELGTKSAPHVVGVNRHIRGGDLDSTAPGRRRRP